MIRIVVQHSPTLFAILGLIDEASLMPELIAYGQTFYRSETHDHYVLYKAALTGWGEAPNLHPQQR